MYHRSLLGIGNSSATQPIQHTHTSTADGVSNAFETIWEGKSSGVLQARKFCNDIEAAAEQVRQPRRLLMNMHGGEHTWRYLRLNAWRCLLPSSLPTTISIQIHEEKSPCFPCLIPAWISTHHAIITISQALSALFRFHASTAQRSLISAEVLRLIWSSMGNDEA